MPSFWDLKSESWKILLPFLLIAGIYPSVVVWREGAPLPRPQSGAAAGVIQGALVVAGGTAWKNNKKLWYRDVQIYDIQSNRWKMGPPLPVPIAYPAFLSSPRGLEILGGSDGSTCYTQCWLLDSGKRTWREFGTLPEPRLYGTAERLGAKVYVVGGSPDLDLGHSTDTLLSLDARAAHPAWKRLAPNTTPFPQGHPRHCYRSHPEATPAEQ